MRIRRGAGATPCRSSCSTASPRPCRSPPSLQSLGETYDEFAAIVAIGGALGIRLYLGPSYRSGVNVTRADGTPDVLWDEALGEEGLRQAVAFVREFDGANGGLMRGALAPGPHRDRHDLGRLAPGAKADFTVVDLSALHAGPIADPIGALVMNCIGNRVRDVIVDGRQVVRDRAIAGSGSRKTFGRGRRATSPATRPRSARGTIEDGRPKRCSRVRTGRSLTHREIAMATVETLAIRGFGDLPVPNRLLRPEGAIDCLAVLLPGFGYTLDMPLFYYAESLLLERGWDVLRVEYAYNRLPEAETKPWERIGGARCSRTRRRRGGPESGSARTTGWPWSASRSARWPWVIC